MQIKSKKRAALLTCFLLIFLFVFQLTSGAVYYIYDINVPTVLQQKSLWCWAACSESVLKYYGITNVSQGNVVSYTFGSEINHAGTAIQVRNALIHYGVHANVASGSMTLSAIQTNIGTNNRPIIAGLLPSSSSGAGHMVVITGYENTLDFKTVTYMDPATASYANVTYSAFCNDSTNSRYWAESVNQLYLSS